MQEVLLRYTICFCCCGDKVLMLYRSNAPNRQRWNGLGGKLEAGEAPLACVHREILEEADIDLRMAERLHYAGIVTWNVGSDLLITTGGMYAFIADLPHDWPIWEGERETEEGWLCWKTIGWVCDPGNSSVVSNIPHFLPYMLIKKSPQEYFCAYQGDELMHMVVRELPGFARI
ncbi:MAG: NUDIX hydrolase [Ktedonobacteraceae bacterium]